MMYFQNKETSFIYIYIYIFIDCQAVVSLIFSGLRIDFEKNMIQIKSTHRLSAVNNLG